MKFSNYQSFLFYTDLEPDDLASLLIFVTRISQLNHPVDIGFMVGEGNRAIKAARMQKMIEQFKKMGFLKNANVQIIQGYSGNESVHAIG